MDLTPCLYTSVSLLVIFSKSTPFDYFHYIFKGCTLKRASVTFHPCIILGVGVDGGSIHLSLDLA
jgi:hypothetical protein